MLLKQNFERVLGGAKKKKILYKSSKAVVQVVNVIIIDTIF